MIEIGPKKIPEQLRADIKSIDEERTNMISHGIGLLLSLIGIPFLINHAYNSENFEYLLGHAFV